MSSIFGAYKASARTANLLTSTCWRLRCWISTANDARRAGDVRAALRARGTPIGPYDVLIAGQALARGLILVTHNVAEFSRVEGLRVENWQGAPLA